MTDVVIIEGDDPITLDVVETDVQVVEIITEGPLGPQGVRGFSWFHGNGVPGIIANTVAGDFYVDDLTGKTYTCTDAGAGIWVETSNILGTLGTAAAASAAAALASEQAAAASAGTASAQAAAALASAGAADVSEAAALVSQNAAAASAVAADASADAAALSAADANTDRGWANTARLAAEAAQSAAAISEANALTSANNAATAETNAETAETNAETAETNAEAAAAAALASQNAASGFADAAQANANLADADRIAAQAAASAASGDAGLASTKATEAAASALAADGSADAAALSAISASVQADAAAVSMNNALTAENNAETAQAAAEAALALFKGQYLGAFAANPTLDGNGAALTAGDLYFNTVAQEMRVYDGAAWAAAYLPAAGYATDAEVNAAIDAHQTEFDAHEQYTVRHGFEIEDGQWLATLSYDKTTRVVTVTPTGAAFNVWVDGKKFTKNGAQAAPAHANTLGGHFITYDDNGNLGVSTTPWSLTDSQKTPVAFVYWNPTLADGVCFFELHTYERSRQMHANLHATQGTKVVSGFAAAGYTLNVDSDVGVTMSFGSGVVADEDIFRTNPAIADGGPYTIWYRDGLTGEWKWDQTPVLPFFHGTYPRYNYDAGGGTGWTRADIPTADFVNYWVFVSTSVGTNGQVFLVPGQQYFTSQTAAEAESLADINWGSMPFQEIAPLYRLTFEAKVSYGGTAKAKLVAITRQLGGGATVSSGVSPSNHSALSGRGDTASHPATAISNTPYANIAATNVQAAINELEDSKTDIGHTQTDRSVLMDISALGDITGAVEADLSVARVFTGTCVGACTWTFSNLVASHVNTVTLVLTNPGVGLQTWPAGVVFDRNAAPTLPAVGKTALMFETYDNGASWIASQIWRNVA